MVLNEPNIAVLFVDDDQGVLESYKKVLGKTNVLDLQSIRIQRQSRKRGRYNPKTLSRTSQLAFNPLFAASGEEGVELVQQEKNKGNRVAVGFFDMNMPGGIDGLETIRQIKRLEPEMLCAVVTAYTDYSVSNISQVFSHQDEWIYFNKPFTKGELEQSVTNMVNLWNNQQFQRRLLDGLQQNNHILMQITNEINLKSDIDQILDFIIQMISQLTKSQRISVMLLEDNREYLSIKRAIGIDEEIVRKVKIRAGEPIAGEVLRQGKILLVDDVHKLRSGELYSEFNSFVSIPLVMVGLKTCNNPIGIINVTNKANNEAYTEDDLRILTYIANSASIAINNQLNIIKLEEAYFNTVEALALAIEAKDPYTRGHSRRVAEYCVYIARQLGIPEPEIRFIKYGAILHDIGKIALDNAIIQKPAGLSKAEYAEVRKHPVLGEALIKKIRFLDQVMKIVRHHHEKYDGNGYPDKIRADEIEIGARIITVADAYDAMLSERPYRNALSEGEAIVELKRYSGEQFDPQCVAALLKHLDSIKSKKIKH